MVFRFDHVPDTTIHPMVSETKNASHPKTLMVSIESPRAKNGVVKVSVSDTSVGLPPWHSGQIFNAFSGTKLHGTGMGLSVCRFVRPCPHGVKISDTHGSKSSS
jgi:nitrogen fixation/metabolism regulation signal transduction histidine kinase